MLLIPCPYCGAREETEFTCGGEAHIARPLEPEKLSDAAWGDYVFMRKNPKGVHYERWNHARGCRRWARGAGSADAGLRRHRPGRCAGVGALGEALMCCIS